MFQMPMPQVAHKQIRLPEFPGANGTIAVLVPQVIVTEGPGVRSFFTADGQFLGEWRPQAPPQPEAVPPIPEPAPTLRCHHPQD